MHTLRNILSLFLAAVLMTACTADDYEYCQYQCYLYFDCGTHQGTVLQGCLNPVSPGQFCILWQSQTDGIRHIKMQLSDQKTEDVPITTALETKRSCILGLDNGLVIGCSSLNDGQLYAFDRACPNCLKNSLHKPLQWANNGLWLKCSTCGRSYDLNNSGYVVSGDTGDKLLRYRASYMGTLLMITN